MTDFVWRYAISQVAGLEESPATTPSSSLDLGGSNKLLACSEAIIQSPRLRISKSILHKPLKSDLIPSTFFMRLISDIRVGPLHVEAVRRSTIFEICMRTSVNVQPPSIASMFAPRRTNELSKGETGIVERIVCPRVQSGENVLCVNCGSPPIAAAAPAADGSGLKIRDIRCTPMDYWYWVHVWLWWDSPPQACYDPFNPFALFLLLAPLQSSADGPAYELSWTVRAVQPKLTIHVTNLALLLWIWNKSATSLATFDL